MRKQKRQTVKKLMQCAAIIAAGVLAIILFMLAIWYIGKNSEPVTDEQVAAQMQQLEWQTARRISHSLQAIW